MPIAVIIDWYGPYWNLEALEEAMKEDWAEVPRAVYMALASGNTYQYIGLTTNPTRRINRHHVKLADRDNTKFFVGEIVTQGISGRRRVRTPPDLRLAETTLIRCLQPALNERKIRYDPDDCVSIFSCFYDPQDYETAIFPLKKFPLHIGFNPWSDPPWFTHSLSG